MINIFRKAKIFSGAGFRNLSSIPVSAGVIPAANVAASGGGDLVVFVPPGNGFLRGGSVGVDAGTALYTAALLPTAASKEWYTMVKVPAGATALSSAKLVYQREFIGNLNLRFYFYKFITATGGNAVQADETDAYARYACAAADFVPDIINIPAGAFNGLTGLAANMLIGIRVDRNAVDVLDTYEGDISMLGLLLTFT